MGEGEGRSVRFLLSYAPSCFSNRVYFVFIFFLVVVLEGRRVREIVIYGGRGEPTSQPLSRGKVGIFLLGGAVGNTF